MRSRFNTSLRRTDHGRLERSRLARTGILLTTLLACSSGGAAAQTEAPLVAGWIENVRVSPGNFVVKAKLDTGARTSSMDAQNIQLYERDGEAWVSFDFANNDGTSIFVDRPIIRVARIKDLTGPTQERPVIELGICIANVYRIAEITLFDRSGFNYRLLLGRNFLRLAAITVDPAKTQTQKPHCTRPAMP